MVLQYLHGIETIDVDDSIRPIRTVRSAIIGVIGTAPDADPDIWPLNVPVLIAGNPRTAVTLGTRGTLPDAANSIFKVTNPVCVFIRVQDGSDMAHTWSNIVGSPITQTGVYAFNKSNAILGFVPKLLIAPGFTQSRPADGVARVDMTSGGDTNYTKNVQIAFTGGGGQSATAIGTVIGGLVTAITPTKKGFNYTTPPTVTITDLGLVAASDILTFTGNAADGETVVIGSRTYTLQATLTNSANNVKIGATAADTIGNLMQAINAGTGSGTLYGTGTTINADVSAASSATQLTVTSKTPGAAANAKATTTTIANASWGTTTLSGGVGGAGATATAVLGTVANPVAAELNAVCPGLRAICIVDSQGTSYDDAISYGQDFDSMRMWIVEGGFQIWDDETSAPVVVPVAPLLAAAQAKVDDENGFWFSASNRPIDGVIGVNRAIDFSLFSSNSEGQLLNEKGIAVTVGGEGFRVMGVRSPTSDPLWAFLSVRRTADMVYESIEFALRSAVDKPISVGLIDWIEGSVRSYLRYLKGLGAIIDGNAWIDRTVNPVTELQNGHLTIDFDLEPPAPLERLTFRAHRNANYYTEILNAVIQNSGV